MNQSQLMSQDSLLHDLASNDNTVGLERDFFVSQSLFEIELSTIFSNNWLAGANTVSLSQPGDFIRLDIADHNLLLSQGYDGVVRVLANICRHRGCQLIDDESGKHKGAFRCPYHGWSYLENGSLVAAPNMSTDLFDQPFRFQDHGLLQYSIESFANQWFIRLSNDASDENSLSHFLSTLQTHVAPWFQSNHWLAGKRSYEVAANWKLLFQNYNECYHCRPVHPELNSLTHADSASNVIESGPILGGPMRLNDGVQSMSTDGQLCGQVFDQLSEDDARRVYYYTVFPNFFISPHPDYVMTHRLVPISPSATQIECEFWFDESAKSQPNCEPDRAIEFWDKVNRQDWQICETAQKGVSRRNYRPGPYSNAESMVSAFDSYYREALLKSLN